MGDWIKAQTNLHRQPEVIGIAGRLRIDIDAVVGKLLRVWAWADSVTTDGRIKHVTPGYIDDLARRRGFAEAMLAVGWLESDDAGLTIPHFDRHNGESAKKRAMDAERQRNVREMSRSERDNGVTKSDEKRDQRREEKNREENTNNPPTPLGGVGGNAPPPPRKTRRRPKTAEEMFNAAAERLGIKETS